MRNALDAVLPSPKETRDTLEGQFGNPIESIQRRVERSEEVRGAWERWQRAGLVRDLRDDVEGRVDEDGVLHFRLDKQAAFQGSLASAKGADAIDIQVKLKAYPAKREEILRVARQLLSEAD